MSRLLLLFSLLSVSSLQAMDWRSWDEGLQEAKQTDKIIMIDAVREGCHYCDDMEQVVFDDKAMSSWIEQRFIPVKIDLAREKMPLGLDVGMTPSFYFIDQEMVLLKTIPGSWDQEDFKDLLLKVGP